MLAKLVGKGAQTLVGALFVVAAAIGGFAVGSIAFPALLGALAGAGIPGAAGFLHLTPVVGLIVGLAAAYKAGGIA